MKNLSFVVIGLFFLSGCATTGMDNLNAQISKIEQNQKILTRDVELNKVSINSIELRLSALEKSILASIKKSAKSYTKITGEDPTISFHHKNKLKIANFESGEFKLTKTMQSQIRAYHVYLVGIMRKEGKLKLEIEGWADAQGDAFFNQSLSDKRAEMVCYFLDSLMSNEERQKIEIHAVGKGEHKMTGGQFRYVSFKIA